MRLRIQFEKTALMRYTGHLDLHRAWERSFRRARLPLAYSQGFNPHPRLNLASALPLGFTSQAEILDAWLEQDLPLDQVAAALQPALPPGIRLVEVREVEGSVPALQTQIQAAEYCITLLEPVADLERRIAETLAAASLPRQRRGKEYDLRPLILHLQALPPDADGCPRLLARLSAREGAVGRPEELVEALGLPSHALRVHRQSLIFDPPSHRI